MVDILSEFWHRNELHSRYIAFKILVLIIEKIDISYVRWYIDRDHQRDDY